MGVRELRADVVHVVRHAAQDGVGHGFGRVAALLLVARFDERFRRIGMVYLVGCAEMFRSPTGQTHLFQVVFGKGNVDRRSYPMTRSHLYAA